jgi:hypothetical protein
VATYGAKPSNAGASAKQFQARPSADAQMPPIQLVPSGGPHSRALAVGGLHLDPLRRRSGRAACPREAHMAAIMAESPNTGTGHAGTPCTAAVSGGSRASVAVSGTPTARRDPVE